MTSFDQIAAQLVTAYRLENSQATAVVDHVIRTISEAIDAGDPVILPGLGTFTTSIVAERQDRHPSTGGKIYTPASRSVTFDRFF